jgi:dihydropteroate synthase
MGTGNLTELTDADTSGITATLLGICSELAIRNVLTVQVSPHTRRTVEEHDVTRRMMFAARVDQSLPRDYSDALLSLHARKPFPNTPAEIRAFAAEIRDDNFRLEAAEDGIHLYNRSGHWLGDDPFALYPHIADALRDDPGHAFYLGVECTRAEIAVALGKRYAQDTPLDWGVAAKAPPEEDLTRFKEAGATLHAGRRVTEKDRP